MKSRIIAIVLLSLFVAVHMQSQKNSAASKWEINGYLTNMQSVSISALPDDFPEIIEDFSKGDHHLYNTNINFQNRLNVFYYASDKLTFSAQMRNRLLVGDQVRLDFTGALKDSYENSGNFVNTSLNVASGNSYIFNMAFDRLYAEYTSGQFDVTLGKQRINWGKTFAFNPNDMFNTYSYFDFDYEEKPGVDAARLMYYTGATTSIEMAASIDSASQLTAAAKWNANFKNYDFQFIGGVLKGNDLALGLGWSGYIKNASWRGELAWYQPFENFADTTGVVMLSTGMDFTLGSKWTLQGEMMLAHFPDSKSINYFDAYAAPNSVKDLAISPFQFLASAMFQASPLSNISLATIFYPHPDIKGIFLGPSWDYCLSDNFNASVYWQVFHGRFPDSFSGDILQQTVHYGFLRLKYSF